MLRKEDMLIRCQNSRRWNTVTHWRVLSVLIFLLLLMPIFKDVLPYLFPLLYVNEIHSIVTLHPFLSFFTLIVMVNFSYWLFYLVELFLKQYLFFNSKLFKTLYTVGFSYFIISMLMSLYRLVYVGYHLI